MAWFLFCLVYLWGSVGLVGLVAYGIIKCSKTVRNLIGWDEEDEVAIERNIIHNKKIS